MIAAPLYDQRGEAAYRAHPFVSNSDLSRLKGGYLNVEAFRFGTLTHSMILEFPTVDIIKGTIQGKTEQYSEAEIKLARTMRLAFINDSFCRRLLDSCSVEVEMYNANTAFSYDGHDFAIDTKRKYDLWSWAAGWGGDLKSTQATTEREFLRDVDQFDYDRGRVFYAAGPGALQDVIIGISKKVPHKIFKVFMKRGDPIWMRGERKLISLAHDYWQAKTPF